MNEKLLKLLKAVQDKKQVESGVKTVILKKYADKGKIKALTVAERLDRIEELLGVK